MATFDFMLPYYGDVQLMQDAVRSVLAQTDRDFRLVVIDDGKEPDVPGWFEQLGDERVHYTRNERNLGITKNFQKCVELSEADYVVIMGCDDLLHPHYLETVRSVIGAHPGIGMVQPGVEVIDGEGRVMQGGLADNTKKRLYAPQVKGRRLMAGEDLAASVLRGNWLYFPSIAWRGEALRKVNFRDDYSVIQDLALVVDLLEGGEEMVIDHSTTVFQYRRRRRQRVVGAGLLGHPLHRGRAVLRRGRRTHGRPRLAQGGPRGPFPQRIPPARAHHAPRRPAPRTPGRRTHPGEARLHLRPELSRSAHHETD